MIKRYYFDYDDNYELVLEVDTLKFKKEHAVELLDFFSWGYDKDANPIDEYLKKIALECYSESSSDFSIDYIFKNKEGFPPLDGSTGIKFIKMESIEVEECLIDLFKTESSMNMVFEKDTDGRWYAVVPDWEGDRSALEMVMGADTMLDILAQGEPKITVFMSTEPFDNYQMKLTFDREEADGAWYKIQNGITISLEEVWLCSVTKFVFGSYPKTLYLR